MDDKKLMSAAKVAERLCASKRLVYQEILRGKLKCYRLGNRGVVRISEEQLEEYLKNVEE